ncbi:MAG TPA: hypothetical protein VHO72_07325 [Bacteroidales bacterium]|nr:hypothetical protein [Bacteroidales bacterium]
MKKLILAAFIIISGTTFGQVTPDTLVKLGGKKLPVIVKNVTSIMIYYVLPDKPKESLKIDKKNVEKIIYRDGKIDPFNQAAFTLIEEGRWEAVLLTYDEKDISGLYKRGVLLDNRSAPSANKKKAEQNVIMKIQKRAANMKGTIVLITRKQFYGAYGDDTGCIMDGVVYGTEPLEEGTDVIKDKKETGTTKTANESKTGTTKTSGNKK